MWKTNEPSISLHDLKAEVVATLARLAERRFSDDQAAHSIASGSLLVRPDDDAFTFIHQSVMEWLVAAHGAREVKDSGTAEELLAGPMSRLMAAFFTDLAGHDEGPRLGLPDTGRRCGHRCSPAKRPSR